jgi:hypothetical protein
MKQTHIIHKLNIDIDVPDLITARHIYNNFSGIWNDKILPELEQRLNNVATNPQSFRINQLNIELQADSVDQIEETLAITLSGELIHFSKNSPSPATVINTTQQDLDSKKESGDETGNKAQVTSRDETIVNSFLYFLQYGQLPWFVVAQNSWIDEAEILYSYSTDKEKYNHQLITIILKDNKVIERLLLQFTSEFCIFIAVEITGIEQNKIAAIVESKKGEIEIAQILRQLLRIASNEEFKIDSNNYNLEEQLNKLLTQIAREKKPNSTEEILIPILEKSNDQSKIERKQDEKTIVEENELYISYGGLILLHPFLQYYFKQFNLVTDKGFVNEEAKETAIHLLYYLATSNEKPYEYELAFIKYLCDWPQQLPLHRFINLSDEMKAESENMLNAVIRHWKILKATTPNGLRESFLKRNGKLILSEQQHKLLLEKSGIDILLEHIPWNHSIISLPWMKKILYAEW